MTGVKRLNATMEPIFKAQGWELAKENPYDFIYSRAGELLQFTKIAFVVYKDEKIIKEITHNCFLSQYLAEMPITTNQIN